MIFKYTQIRRKINKFQAVEQNIVYKKATLYIYTKTPVRIYVAELIRLQISALFATV